MTILCYVNDKKKFQRIENNSRIPYMIEKNLIIILFYLYDPENEFLLILVPEIYTLIDYMHNNKLKAAKIADFRCMVILIAIKFEFFRSNLEKRIIEQQNVNFYTANLELILEFVLYIKILIITIFLGLLKDGKTAEILLK